VDWRDAVDDLSMACSDATVRPLGHLLRDAATEARCVLLDARRGAVAPIIAAPSAALALEASHTCKPPPRKRCRAAVVTLFGVKCHSAS
jgi:hypothetical protein